MDKSAPNSTGNEFSEASQGETHRPSSIVQIRELEASRPAPSPEQNYTPGGSLQATVDAQVAAKRNREIDKEVTRMKERLAARRNQAREGFERVCR